MKMDFKTLNGTIGLHIAPITINSDFEHKDVRRLLKELNYCIRVYKILPATAINLQHFWYNLTMAIKHYTVRETNRKDNAYIEILKGVDKIKKTITSTDSNTEELKQEVERLKAELAELKYKEAANNIGLVYDEDGKEVSKYRVEQEYRDFFVNNKK